MRTSLNSYKTRKEVSAARKFMAFGAIGLVTTLGVAVPAGAVTSSNATPAAHVSLTSHTYKITHVTFRGTYTGTMALLWSSTGVRASSVTGHGTGTDGANTMKGSGGGSAAANCDPFSGAGNLVGPSGLKLTIVSSSKTQACAINSAAPTPVTVNGVAKILSGTGKFRGASGSLTFKGSFAIQNTTAGSAENDSFNAKITGTITIRTIVS